MKAEFSSRLHHYRDETPANPEHIIPENAVSTEHKTFLDPLAELFNQEFLLYYPSTSFMRSVERAVSHVQQEMPNMVSPDDWKNVLPLLKPSSASWQEEELLNLILGYSKRFYRVIEKPKAQEEV